MRADCSRLLNKEKGKVSAEGIGEEESTVKRLRGTFPENASRYA
jgi:hypothetical protein